MDVVAVVVGGCVIAYLGERVAGLWRRRRAPCEIPIHTVSVKRLRSFIATAV